MKRYVSRFSILIIFGAFISGAYIMAADIYVRVTATGAVIRLKPNNQDMIITSVPVGAILTSNDKINDWFKVFLPPDESGALISGYIHQSLVELVDEKPGQDIKTESKDVRYKLRIVALRSSIKLKPSSGASEIGTIPGGALINSYLKLADWYKIDLPADKSNIIVSGFIKQEDTELLEEIKPVEKPVQIPEKVPVAEEKREESAGPETEAKKPGASFKGGFSFSFPTGDISDYFGLGLGVLGTMSIPMMKTPLIDLVGSIEGMSFMKASDYSDLTWARIALGADGRLRFPSGKICPFIQAGLGLYLDFLRLYSGYYYLESTSEFDLGVRFGAGISFGKIDIYALYHLVDRGAFQISFSYTLAGSGSAGWF